MHIFIHIVHSYSTYIHTYITYIHTFIYTYIHSYILVYTYTSYLYCAYSINAYKPKVNIGSVWYFKKALGSQNVLTPKVFTSSGNMVRLPTQKDSTSSGGLFSVSLNQQIEHGKMESTGLKKRSLLE